jgi:hypothetical protein
MSAEAKLRGVSVWDKDLKKSFRAMILDELKRAQLRVPELVALLRTRTDLRWWHKLYLWTVASGSLYVDMRRMEDAGMVDAIQYESSHGVILTRWRGRTLCEMVVDWRAVPDGEGGFSPGEEIYCSNFAVAMVEKTVPACEACATRTREEGIPITPLVPPESAT